MSGSIYFNECALDTSFTTWLIVIGSVQVLLTPCRCIGYSCDGQDARNFKSIVFKCVIIFLHVGGIAVSCYKVVHARNSWNDHGHPVCTGSDPTTDPTNPIFPTDPTIDPTDSTIYCCHPAVMHLMLSLVIINCILGCLSCCCSGIVSLLSYFQMKGQR